MNNQSATMNTKDNPLGYKKESTLLVGFAIPCIISMLVTALYNIVAQIFIGQGIGMALYENVTYNAQGKIAENSFMQYKIPTRLDMGRINVEFETSYEPSGPFGVKSIGEIVINTPAPALAHAIYRATGVWHRTVPFTPEKILMSMLDPQWKEIDRRVKES